MNYDDDLSHAIWGEIVVVLEAMRGDEMLSDLGDVANTILLTPTLDALLHERRIT